MIHIFMIWLNYMNKLDLSQINVLAPYPVWYEEGEILFKTDYNILYSVAFELDDVLSLKAYWFRITNRSAKKSPSDKKVQQTIIHIIEEFFQKNPDILLYMCDTANEQQAQRDRLFLRWFNAYEQKKKYVIKSAVVMDEGEANYVSLIVPVIHPQLEAIINTFDREISMFQNNK